MRKTSSKSFAISATYLVIAFVLCAGIILYTGNGGTGATTVADITETMPETGTDEIVAGDEEVPLAKAPKVTVKKSTKTTTKKKTLKKAATKTKTVTKKKTSKKKSSKKSASVQTITETTVQTTQKTSTKKKSKVQTIKTTVVTTVKTTQTDLGTTTSNGASTATAVATSGFAISNFSDIKGHVDSKVYNAYTALGFGFSINSSLNTTGVFSVSKKKIELKRGQSSYLLHELGHFVAALKDTADETSEFKNIYNAEKASYVGNNKAYVTQDAGEYFAESFRDYTENPSALKSQRPKTYAYINKMVESISNSDVNWFKNYYWMYF